MSDPIESPSALLAALKGMRAGIPNLPAGTTQIVAGGQVSTPAQLEAELDTYIATYQAAEDAELALQNAEKARDTLAVTVVPRFEALRTSFKGMLGKKNPDLTKVGLEPDKTPAPLTLQQKQAKAAKAAATRKARGTLGPKQKAAIKGQVPPATPPAPAPKPGA